MEFAVTFSSLDEAVTKLGRLANLDKTHVNDIWGALVVSQTQRRIASEKRSPDGASWPANIRGGSILFQKGRLHGSIYHVANAQGATVGSPLVYARIHNEGGRIAAKNKKALKYNLGGNHGWRMTRAVNIPKRQYLGISAENAAEIETVIGNYLKGLVQ